MKEIKECNLCKSKKIKPLFRLKDRLYAIEGKFCFSICKNCGLIFQNPLLSDKELSKYYPKDYIAYDKTKSNRDKMITLLYKTYYSNNGRWYFKILFFPFKSLLRSMPYKKWAKYLDIGCGDGSFLKLVKQRGMEPHGVDLFIPSSIQELNIKNISLFKAKYKDNTFDFITLNNVLEHVQNPKEILIECRRILKKDGKIFVNVPNSSSLNYKLFYSNWISLDPPRHTYIFSNRTLKEFGKLAGLKIEKINYKSESFTILGSLIYVIDNLLGGRSKVSESKIIANPIINIFFLPIAMIYNLLRIGDQTEIVYVKK